MAAVVSVGSEVEVPAPVALSEPGIVLDAPVAGTSVTIVVDASTPVAPSFTAVSCAGSTPV